jgi:hypothetical protein
MYGDKIPRSSKECGFLYLWIENVLMSIRLFRFYQVVFESEKRRERTDAENHTRVVPIASIAILIIVAFFYQTFLAEGASQVSTDKDIYNQGEPR